MALSFDPATLRIPVEAATLDNGLRVVAHRDRKSPIVAVHIAYRAGSREEPPGKHGLAHLFEHLMFSGSEHLPENFFIPMERIGAASINAHAADDYAAYFATVPVAALDYALWMEAERMSCLAAALNQAALDRQREIVGNELLQRAAEPYGRAASLIRRDSYPPGHPYAHHPYGVLEDLDNISLDDVLRWYETHYHPANATLVIAGDIEPRDAIENARRRFGPLASGPVDSQNVTGAAPASEARLTLYDEHAPPRLYRIWNAPGIASMECAEMELACEIFAGESSSLRKWMIEETGLAINVSIEFQKRELGSQVILSAIAAPVSRLSDLESELDAALSRFLGEIASEQDCASAKARIVTRFLRDMERVGGRSGKADRIATLDLATGDPNFVGAHLERLASLDSRQVVESAARWLGGGGSSEISLRQRDEPRLRAGRSRDTIPPAAPSAPAFRWPHVAHAELDNGLRVIAGQRPGTRMVELRLVIGHGAASDDLNESGLAGVAMRLLGRIRMEENEGDLANALARDGSTFRARATLDGSSIEISTLPDRLADVFAFLKRAVTTREFDESDLARAKSDAIASIRDEAARPSDLALRVFPRLAYPDNHPYAQPFSGSGTEEGVARVTVERVKDFYSRAMCANRATVIAIGPFEASEMVAQIKRVLGDWRPSSESSTQPPPIPKFERRRSEAISLIDRRGMPQAAIFAALALPPHRDPDIDGLVVADAILGGTFNSRLNLAFREQSGWSYGAYSRMFHARHGGLWIAYSFVRRDRVPAAIEEMRRQLPIATQGHPIDDLEFASARDHLIATLPARYETNAQLADALQEAVLHDLPDDYHANFASRVARLHPHDFRAECARWINEANITWIVIGEAERLRAEMLDRL